MLSHSQKSRKESRLWQVLCAIEDCPRQGKPASTKDPFGKPLVCKCGYHKISTKVNCLSYMLVLTQVGYCTAYIQKYHFVWSFHLGQFSFPTSGSPSSHSLPLAGPSSSSSHSLPLAGPSSSSSHSLPLAGPSSSSSHSLPLAGPSSSSSHFYTVVYGHLLHPPHSSSFKTLLLWTSHSSCGRPNFLAFFCAYFVCCQDASSSGRSLLVQFSGGTYCDN